MLNFGKQGFTLVELIITISILTILGTIGFFSYQGYEESARDSHRISELNIYEDSLVLFSLRNELPMPENSITIKSGTDIIGYQGDLGADALLMVGYLGKGTDPLDNNFYTYERSKDGKFFQILALLEQPYNTNGEILKFTSGEEKYVYVVGNGLGILTTNEGVPIHRDENIKAVGEIDLSTTPDGDIIAYIENDLGLMTDYNDLLDVVKRGGKGYGIEDRILIDYLAEQINGVCGADNGLDFTVEPINLCSAGNASTVYDYGVGSTYDWTCVGINLGTTESCNANHALPCEVLAFSFEDNTLGTWVEVTGTAVSPTTWITDSGGTPSSNTGPSTASDGSYYIFAETSSSNANPGKTFIIENDITCQNTINFDYHAYGATIGTLLVQEYDGSVWTDSYSITGQQQTSSSDLWKNTGNISFTPGTTKVRLHYTSGTSYTGDFAIDNIGLLEGLTCATNPGYLHADYTIGNPLVDLTSWQNTNSGDACYYVCTDGYTGSDCSTPPVIDGVCGTDHLQDLGYTPTNLCSSGNPTAVSDNGVGFTYDWGCDGTGGGANVSCNANHIEVVNINMITGIKTCPIGIPGTTVTEGGIDYYIASAVSDIQTKIFSNSFIADNICTTHVTNMDFLFRDKTTFNQNISSWDTNSVNTMRSMFNGANSFNQNISTWDTGNVTRMDMMFYNAYNFNNGCNSSNYSCSLTWDTSNVTNLYYLFYNANNFNQDVSTFILTSASSLEKVFNSADDFNNGCAIGDYSCPLTWNTSTITNFLSLFDYAIHFNQNISTWDTSNVDNMVYVFSSFVSTSDFNNGCAIGDSSCPLLWDTVSATNMFGMFQYAESFNQDIPNFDISNVTSVQYMFKETKEFNQDLSSWSGSGDLVTSCSSFAQNAIAWSLPKPTFTNCTY